MGVKKGGGELDLYPIVRARSVSKRKHEAMYYKPNVSP